MKKNKNQIRPEGDCFAEKEDRKPNSSPVCYADSAEIRSEYRIEALERKNLDTAEVQKPERDLFLGQEVEP
ncbi:MAG: hypothetical protein R2828_19655 [Saprospiraceae bacterium]